MGLTNIWVWVVILVVVLVLFGGRGKISALMTDFGKGLKGFKQGMKDDDAELSPENKSVTDKAVEADASKTEQTVKN